MSSAVDKLFETDLKGFAAYYVLLLFRDELSVYPCSGISKNGERLYVIRIADLPYGSDRKLAEGVDSHRVFKEEIVRRIRESVQRIFKFFVGPRFSEYLKSVEEAASTMIDYLFDSGSISPVYKDENECRQIGTGMVEKIDGFEEEHYEKLRSSYTEVAREILTRYSTLSASAISSLVLTVLRKNYEWITGMGSRSVYVEDLSPELRNVVDELLNLGLIHKSRRFGPVVVFPAPLLEEGLVERALAQPLRKPEAAVQTVPTPIHLKPVRCRDIVSDRPPSREILEGIVANVLRGLGFSIRVDARLPNRSGGETEVDVWATRGQFKVYVSCKNWDRDIGRGVIEEEFGRLLNLRDIPHLKILVAKSLSEDARRTALADGFYVIELGMKAEDKNSTEVCEVLAGRLAEIFISIAPPQLAEAYKRIEEVGKLVEDLSKKVEELKRTLGTP